MHTKLMRWIQKYEHQLIYRGKKSVVKAGKPVFTSQNTPLLHILVTWKPNQQSDDCLVNMKFQGRGVSFHQDMGSLVSHHTRFTAARSTVSARMTMPVSTSHSLSGQALLLPCLQLCVSPLSPVCVYCSFTFLSSACFYGVLQFQLHR